MKLIEPPTLAFVPKVSTSSMAATASSVIAFTMFPLQWPSQQAKPTGREADHDTAQAEDSRRQFGEVFQAEESDDGAPRGTQEYFHDRAGQAFKHAD